MTSAQSTTIISPFRHRIFAYMWGAMVLSNVGVWMHEMAAGWVMTELTTSPILVSLLQVCTALPIFLFSLVAGSLGDRFDRRRLLIVFQSALIFVSAGLALLVFAGLITPSLLLMFSFLSGMGLAFSSPIRQAVLPLLVPRADIRSAVALNGIGFNASRAVGPALGGVIVALGSAALAFALNAICYVFVVLVLWIWRPEAQVRQTVRAGFRADIFEGLTTISKSNALRSSMIRSTFFVFFASVTWALLPLIVRGFAGADAFIYGVGVMAMGLGAIIGGLAIPRLHNRFSTEWTVLFGTVMTVLPLLLLATNPSTWAAIAALACVGVGWVCVNTTINTAVQLLAEDQLRARLLSVYLVLYAAAMVLGSLLWGALARAFGIDAVLASVAVCLLLTISMTRWWPVTDDR